MDDLRVRMTDRLAVLEGESMLGEERLRQLEGEEAVLRETLLRIAGAIQVLHEILGGALDGTERSTSDTAPAVAVAAPSEAG
jgi:hypothetical protein